MDILFFKAVWFSASVGITILLMVVWTLNIPLRQVLLWV
jgi:hypothetical protein